MNKRTRGPWYNNEGSICARWETGDEVQVACMNITHWTTDPTYVDVELNRRRNERIAAETKGNTVLIESAPELADALLDIYSQLAGIEGRQYKWIRTRAQAALKKAGLL